MTDALTAAFADEWGRVVAALVRVAGDWALAEDATQDAFAAAAVAWPRDGVPDSPGAWLMTVARRRALDRLRRAQRERRALPVLADLRAKELEMERREPDDVPDDRLRLIFTCCHPALPLEARVALTLRTLCGLTVAEIAATFGVAEPAMAKRLTRARHKIAAAHIPYRVPSGADLAERLTGVLAVLYLLFTEGYAPTGGHDGVRPDLTAEALRLTRALAALLPDQREIHALLALESFSDSRRAARIADDGAAIPLDEQDRSLWNADLISAGRRALDEAERMTGPPGRYLLQARIAAEHARGLEADRGAVVRAYEELLALAPTPSVALARAVAVGYEEGADAGLALLAALRDSAALVGEPLLPAAEADLLRRAGRDAEAAAGYRSALAVVQNDAERRFLERRLREVSPADPAAQPTPR